MYLVPTFFIAGERKCGTSSLYRYLLQHPNVLPCAIKEPNFFGQHEESYIEQNIHEYWALYPSKEYQGDIVFEWPELNPDGILYHETVQVHRHREVKYITGEASANTFFDVQPYLLKKYLPHIKILLVFRDPVQRAFSHHRMYMRFQEEGRELGREIRDFASEVHKEIAVIEGGGTGDFLSPGQYICQLKPWIEAFGASRIKIVLSEELVDPSRAQHILWDIFQFLGIPKYDYGDFLEKHFNKAPTASIPSNIRAKLVQFFRPSTFALQELMGRDLPWEV